MLRLRFAVVALHVASAALVAWTIGAFSLALVAAAGVLALAVQARGHLEASKFAALSLGAMWLGASVTCLVLFPESTWRLVVMMASLALALVLVARPLTLGPWLLASVIGGGVAAAQRAADPSTHPLGGAVGPAATKPFVDVWCGGLPVRVEPLLRFESCAVDRFWALWSHSPCPTLAASSIRVRDDADAGTIIEAESRLDAPVFSHLNDFTTLHLDRAGLSVSLGERAPLRFSDGTARLRFFWLDAEGRVHLTQAAREEKGPFTELDQAPLDGGKLTFTVSDASGPACRFTFETFAAQASVAPSPTAGWDVPENAVEFLESIDDDVSSITLSLAATSVGDGWDTVGHAPGVYRNVIHLEPLRR